MRLIRLKDVCSITGISRSQIYKLSEQGLFPKKVRLTERSVAWLEDEVNQWVAKRVLERNAGGAL